MNSEQMKLANMARTYLGDLLDPEGLIEQEVIDQTVRQLSSMFSMSETQTVEVVRFLEEQFQISMGDGSLFVATDTDFVPWLESFQAQHAFEDWFFWNRYKSYLDQEGFPPKVISKIDELTDKVVDNLQDPGKEGRWKRKGLVVGHVQSGKTANYTGVICKAADAGYRVIVVLAGMLNSLRDQTQVRIEEGFIGQDITRRDERDSDVLVGVGKLNKERLAITFTSRKSDFKKQTANTLGVDASQLKEPVVLVVKKNTSTLRNLIDWLDTSTYGRPLNDLPMLLIDDEADQASINTNKDDKNPTKINEMIRRLLATFSRTSFIGYTATPFANIFIDPSSDDEMLGDDLFPRDFILSLDAPSNYVSAERIFGDEELSDHLDILRDIDDNEPNLPLKHKKDLRPDLPSSLREAIRAYILILAIRHLKGHERKHNSMMINVSRFTDVQSHIKHEVLHYVSILKQDVGMYSKLDQADALGNSSIKELHETWTREYARNDEPTWIDVQRVLPIGLAKVRVVEVNSSPNSEPLVYGGYLDGRNLIAVGGMSLSRGLTLEGLVVSYFLRNSVMYDTLMQMGRWFGYRDGYDYLCRIYMPEEAQSWYSHISSATEELRSEFNRMDMAQMTPSEFGLKVRSHPESLIVTARNKMRASEKITKQVSLYGRLVETHTLLRDSNALENNRQLLNDFVKALQSDKANYVANSSWLWRRVDIDVVSGFIEGFSNHPYSQLTESAPILDYMKKIRQEDGVDTWDVAIFGIRKKERGHEINFDGLTLHTQSRTINADRTDGGKLIFNKMRVASRGNQEGIALSEVELDEIKNNNKGMNVKDSVFRRERVRPLLMIHPITPFLSKEEEPLFNEPVIAYGVSFNGDSAVSRGHLVDYVVNTTYWNTEYGAMLENEEEEGE